MVGLLALACLTTTAPAAGAVTRDGARAKALKATKAERSRPGTILFRLSTSLRPGTAIREAGRRPPPSGSSTRTMRSVLTVRGERAYFFYLDRGAYQRYEHPGRVVLVGARSGRVIRSRTLRFAPVIKGRLPIFLRSREAYNLPAYRVSTRPYAVAGATRARAAAAGLGAFGGEPSAGLRSAASEALVVARLAAERSCTIVIGGRSLSPGSIGSPSGTPVAPLLAYTPARGRSLSSFIATQAVARRGCRDIAIAVTGDGYRSLSPPTVRTSLSTSGSRMREHHLALASLRSAIASNPSVTFKLMIDGPGSGAFIEALRSLSNVLVIATSSTARQTAFRYLPEKEIAGDLRRNPLRMRSDSSFFTTLLFGGAAFSASDAEVVHAAAEVAAGRAPSFLAYMIARAFQLSRPFDFTADLGATQRLYTTFAVTPPGPLNRQPVANAQSVTTAEDTAKPIVLTASDPDGDALTYTVGTPAHGTLAGTAPNLTYTPAANYNGPDSFTFTVSDGTLISATATVSITVTSVDDPPVTTASGTLAYTENGPPAGIAPALTVTDVDSTNLTGAMVQITAGHVAADDLLALPAQPGITAVFDAPTGTLTLSGTATVAAYQAALRAVTYANSSEDPGSAPRTVTFKARDAGGFGPSAMRTITITPVNDPPAITTSAGPLSYTENDPATPVDAGLVLADPDSQITGATVQITGNLAAAEDVLALASPPAGITAIYAPGTGLLTLSGTASVAAYQSALQAVTYRNTSSNPSTAARTLTFLASDASSTSAPATRNINVDATDNAPDVDNSAGALAYTENDPATTIDTTITVTDVDSANLTGATVQITGSYVQGEDILDAPALPGGITSSFDPPTGRMTLSGTASVANYESALELVRYRNTSDTPSTATRTATYQARDAGGFGAPDTHGITIAAVDDPPVAVNDSATVAEDSGATAVPVLTNDTDVDAGPISIGSVTQPANGTVVITGGGTGLTYAPNANYCNSPPGTTPDTFTYTLTPGVSSATVSMTVTCVDDAPVAVNDSQTVAEDSGASTIGVLANDTDIDGGPIAVASVTQPANGTVVNNGTDVTYTPNANYCNSPPGTPDTFTYTLTPGTSTATVSVLVTCSDDPPVAVNDSQTVAEDSGAGTIGVLANDTDIDGGPIAVASVTQPANGTVVNNGTDVTYTPNANYCNSPPGTPDTFTYTLTPGTSIATVSVTVTCATDAPVVDTSAGTTAYTENAAPTPIDSAVTVTDPDASSITGATVQISANFAGAQDVLALGGVHPGITAIQIGDTLTLSGTASTAAYQAALRDVTYANSSDSPSTLLRTVTFTVTDDTALTGSDTKSLQVTAVNDNPVAVNDATTVGEDSGVTLIFVLTNDTDVDGGPIAVSSVTQPANGTVSNNGTDVSYTPNANYCNNPPGTSPDTFTYTLTPGGSTATVSVTVTCAADPPNITTSAGALAYTENDPATPIDAGLTVTDPDAGAMITGATVAITSNFAGAQDVLALAGIHPGITAGPQIGNTLTLTGTATPAAYQSALRDVTYVNTSEGPSTLARTVTFTVTDDTALSDSATRGITVAAVNDPPNAVDDTGTTDEDTPLSVAAPGVLANDTDVDPGDTKTVVALNGTGTLTQTLPSGASVTIAANGSYTYNPLTAFQGLSTGQTASDSFTYTMQDGAGAQDTATVNITINGISDAPTAVADSFDAIGNTGLFVGTTRPATQAGKEITGSLLANDTDPDTPQASLVAEPVTNAPTTLGGTITIESDGNFTYHPDDVDTGVTDTFTYRVCDASPCNAGTVANATGTLSLPIAGQVWYVRNNEPAGGDGTSDTPFDTLAEAEAASGTGDTVFVFDGSNTTTNLDTGYAMNANERLIGESRPLSLDPDGGGPLPTSPLHPGTSGPPPAQPTLTASNEDVVVLASNVLVDGVDVDPSGTGGGISGGAGVDSVTVQNVNVTDTGTAGTQPGIEMDGTTGVNRFTGVTVTNGGSATAIGVRINNADRVLFANTATNTIATTGAKALDAASTSLLTSRWNDITVTGSGTGAIRLSSTTGQPVLGDGSGTDLSLQTTSGATAALDVASSNTVTVDSAGTDTISATGGPAADIRNSNGSQFFFDSASSTNSAGDGVNLDTNLTAPVVINGGTIAGATGIAFDVNGGGVGGGGVVYDGAINDGPGQSVEVTGRDGGGVTFSGNIADSADAGGGIVVASNSQGSTSFSGASKVLNTGAANAVVLTANGNPAGGHLVSFTNGGLDIDTTSGTGLTATNGTLTVGGTGNSITTVTGTGLAVDTAGITSGNLNFDSVSSNGAANGIRLNSTGTTGRLIVTGTGGTCTNAVTSGCTGGEIRNGIGGDNSGTLPTGTGVVLNDTLNPSLTRMWIHDHTNYAIRGTSVAGFTLANSVINGTNGTNGATPFDDSSVRFDNLSGSATVSATHISGGREDNFKVSNTSGSLNRITFTGDTVGLNSTAEGNDGVSLQSSATAGALQATVQSSTFTGAAGDLIDYNHNGTGTGDLVLTTNALSNNHPAIATGGGGLTLSNSGTSGNTTMTIDDNTFRDAVGPGVLVIKTTGASVQTGTFTNNDIGVAAATNSGSAEGSALKLQTVGQGSANWTVTGNQIRGYNNFGVEVLAGGGASASGGAINATITGNTITAPGNTAGTITIPKQAVHLNIGTVPGDTYAACAVISGNSIATGGADGVPATGVDVDVRLRQRQSTTIRLPGYAGSPTDTAAVQAFVAANNPGGTAVLAQVNSPPGGGFTGGAPATCP